jgi:hypothetical protein
VAISSLRTASGKTVLLNPACQLDDSRRVLQSGIALAHLAPETDQLATISRAFYLPAFRNAINVGGQDDFFDTRVGQEFIRDWRTLKTGFRRRHTTQAIRLTDEIRHIFEFNSLEINASADETTLQIIVNGRPRRLDEVGSGLTQFILVLANVAMHEQNYIFIDEPELNLHPTLN